MPDTARLATAPRDWNAAFASLPLDAPGGESWERVAARLPQDPSVYARLPRSRRAARWFGLAAVLALAAVVPWRWAHDAAPTRTAAESSRMPSHAPAAGRPPVADAASRTVIGGSAATPDTAPAAVTHVETSPPPAGLSAVGRDTQTHAVAASSREPSGIRRDIEERGASGSRAASVAIPAVADTRAATDAASPFDALYAESARLEALLSLARDDRVASGAAAALSGDLDTQVAGIDAALSQPGLSDDARGALWRERIDALRQAAAFESTRRMLAAQGERYDAMLVGID